MVVPDDTSKFDRVFSICIKDDIVSKEIIDNSVWSFLFWILERHPEYLDILDENAITLFPEKCVIDWNNGNLYVSVEFNTDDIVAYIKTSTENFQIYHTVPLKVVDDVVYYIQEIGL